MLYSRAEDTVNMGPGSFGLKVLPRHPAVALFSSSHGANPPSWHRRDAGAPSGGYWARKDGQEVHYKH